MSQAADWQTKIREYDRDGPGVCGFYLDLVSLLASLCPLVPEIQQANGEWVTSDDPVLNTLLRGYTSPLTPQAELVGLHVRHRESMGEAWLVNSDHLGWNVVTVPNVQLNRDSVQWTDPFNRRRLTPLNRAWKSWVQDPYEPWRPTSPVRRAIPDLRRLRAAIRNQTRSAESPLATNGIMAFPDDGGGTRPLADHSDNYDGADEVVSDFIDLAKESFQDDDSPAAAVPFPMIGGVPQYVEVGRGIDTASFQVEEKALEAFARSVNFPAQLLTNGPGSANHWNEWLLEEAQRKMGLSPKLIPVCADITEAYFKPMVALAIQRIGDFKGIDIQRVRVGFDTSFLTSKPDTSSELLSAWGQGVIDRDAVIEGLGLNMDDKLEIPEGLSEYEHWQTATSKPGAPYIEVDDDEKVVAHDDVFGGGGSPEDTFGGGAGGEPPPEQPQLPGMDPNAPAPGPGNPALGAGNQAPPPPPPMLAAVNDRSVEQAVIDRLYRADLTLAASLSARAQACVEQTTDHVAREIIKAHPPRSEERARLRDLPSQEVWVNSLPSVQQSFPLRQTIEDAVDRCASRELFDEAAAAALAALAPLGIGDDNLFDPDDGHALFTLLLVGYIANRTESGGKGAKEFPQGDIRAAMAAAGGARRGPDGNLQRSGDGTPVPRDGGPWNGNAGMTTGDSVFRRWPGELDWKWEHSFFGIPETPYPPHVALDGHRFNSLADVPGGYWPGDHKGCRCGLKAIAAARPLPEGPDLDPVPFSLEGAQRRLAEANA